MEDDCVACHRHLATVTPTCGHRLYCNECYDRSVENRTTCAICNQLIDRVQDTSLVQLRPTTLQNSINDFNDLRIDYPFGFLLMGTDEEIADHDMYLAVEQAMNAVQANRLQLDQLKRALKRRLTMAQYQLVFVKFMESSNFHDILLKLDRRQVAKKEYTRIVRRLVVRSIESTDNKAIMARAAITTGLGEAVARGTLGGAYAGAAGATFLVFGVFTALEIYRWSKGLISGTNALKNIGEHAVGALGGYAGFAAGAAAGAAIGTLAPVPVIGTVAGGILGALCGILCDFVSRKVYRRFVPGELVEEAEEQIREQVQLTQKEIVNKAAEKFGINVEVVDFAEAQSVFRRILLASHPDKHPELSEEEKTQLTDETRDIIACWVLVREYYNDNGRIDESECDEGYIKVWVLKAFDAVANQWQTVRTFFDNITLGRDVDPTTERLEQVTIYV